MDREGRCERIRAAHRYSPFRSWLLKSNFVRASVRKHSVSLQEQTSIQQVALALNSRLSAAEKSHGEVGMLLKSPLGAAERNGRGSQKTLQSLARDF
jgi:hypothetical protein